MTDVTAELKFVRNLGNYESAHVGFSITDTKREGETTAEAARRVYSLVEALVDEKVREIDADVRGDAG